MKVKYRFMWRKANPIGFLFPLFVAVVYGQLPRGAKFSDRGQLSFSYTHIAYLINLKYPNRPVFDVSPSIRSLGITSDYVLYHLDDFVALNLFSRAEVGLQFTNPLSYYLSFPVGVVARIGAHATPYNNNSIGVGIGAGISSTYIAYNYTTTQNAYLLQDKELILGVNAIGEFNLRYGTGMGFRISYQLFPFSGTMPVTPFDEIQVTYQIVSLGIVYYLN